MRYMGLLASESISVCRCPLPSTVRVYVRLLPLYFLSSLQLGHSMFVCSVNYLKDTYVISFALETSSLAVFTP